MVIKSPKGFIEISCAIISIMTKLDNRGVINTLLIPLIVIAVALLTAAIFAIWAYSGRQDFKNNVDKKIETAVEIAKKQTASAKDNEFVEKEIVAVLKNTLIFHKSN